MKTPPQPPPAPLKAPYIAPSVIHLSSTIHTDGKARLQVIEFPTMAPS